MGLLCSVALQPGRIPPARIPTNTAVPGSANAMMHFIEVDSQSVHWRDELDRLSDSERDAIAGVLCNIAMRRKIRQREFGAVHQLLKASYALGLADTPSSS